MGTGACVPWRRGQRGDAPAAGGLGEGAGGSPGDARARGAQAWAVLDTLGCGQGCVQAQSAQGMGAQKRGAALPLGSGKARGCSQARRTRRSRVVALIVAFIIVTKVTTLHVLKAVSCKPVTTLNNPATSKKKPRLLLPLVHNYPIKQHDSSAARCPASTVPGTARTQVSMSFVCGGSHAPLLDRNGRLISESSRSRAAS